MKSIEIEWDPLKPIEIINWNQLKSTEIHWNPLKDIGIQWNSVKSIEIYWNPLKAIEINWNHLKSIGIHCNSLKSNEMAEVVFQPQQPLVVDSFKNCEGVSRIAFLDGNTAVMLGEVTKLVFKKDMPAETGKTKK